MSFKKNRYCIIRNVIPPILGEFCARYLEMKKYNHNILKAERYITEFNTDHGYFIDPQAPNTFSIYGDQAMETLFHFVKPKMEKATKLKLYETYAYARLYKKGDVLERHKDRKSCEVSATLNLGGDKWPIFLEPSGKNNQKGVKINLNVGDMLMYKGCELEHWREPFDGEMCVQVFLHYNKKGKDSNEFDGRLHLGLPNWFKGRKYEQE